MISAVALPVMSLLDVGDVPVDELAGFVRREASRPRPAYGAHRWFARRFGTAMRALLVAAATPAGDDFWQGFYGRGGLSLSGLHVLDPFVGGGTILYEAQRLGADVTGVDVDPVACAVAGFQLRAGSFPDPTPALEELRRTVGKRLSGYYRTRVGEEDRVALHYLGPGGRVRGLRRRVRRASLAPSRCGGRPGVGCVPCLRRGPPPRCRC